MMLLVSLHWSLLQSLPHRPFGYYHAISATTLSMTITMPCLLLLTLMTNRTHCLHSNFLAATNADRVLRPIVPLDNEEMAELRRTSTELREVVRYLKRERDLLEARQSVAEGESSRMEASLAATQRALDEARAELKRELDSKATARGEKDFNKLTAEVTQVHHTTPG
jgi:septal ring factor EnvC (AmiA/AmiB activator)